MPSISVRQSGVTRAVDRIADLREERPVLGPTRAHLSHGKGMSCSIQSVIEGFEGCQPRARARVARTRLLAPSA